MRRYNNCRNEMDGLEAFLKCAVLILVIIGLAALVMLIYSQHNAAGEQIAQDIAKMSTEEFDYHKMIELMNTPDF